jgi:hypothetical protein
MDIFSRWDIPQISSGIYMQYSQKAQRNTARKSPAVLSLVLSLVACFLFKRTNLHGV